MNQDNGNVMYDYADRFINLANELAQTDRSGRVGMAIRFAAARFSVFEVTTQTDNLAGDKEKYVLLISEDFENVLRFNFDDYIRVLNNNPDNP